MIRECLVDHAVNRLLEHFGKRVVVRPPASAADLAQLEVAAGPLPRSYAIFLSTCNGLMVNLAGNVPGCELHHTHQILAELADPVSPPIPPGLIPVRGERDGERDWLIVEPGGSHGVVMRWDPWSGGAGPVASSFDHYLDAWSLYLVKAFDGRGSRCAKPPAGKGLKRRAIEFDRPWVQSFDPELSRVCSDPSIRAWMREMNLAVGTGDDFE
jgi:hypothetical protein